MAVFAPSCSTLQTEASSSCNAFDALMSALPGFSVESTSAKAEDVQLPPKGLLLRGRMRPLTRQKSCDENGKRVEEKNMRLTLVDQDVAESEENTQATALCLHRDRNADSLIRGNHKDAINANGPKVDSMPSNPLKAFLEVRRITKKVLDKAQREKRKLGSTLQDATSRQNANRLREMYEHDRRAQVCSARFSSRVEANQMPPPQVATTAHDTKSAASNVQIPGGDVTPLPKRQRAAPKSVPALVASSWDTPDKTGSVGGLSPFGGKIE